VAVAAATKKSERDATTAKKAAHRRLRLALQRADLDEEALAIIERLVTKLASRSLSSPR